MNAKREARRERNKEDFLRATRAATNNPKAGANAGRTQREMIEDKLAKAVQSYRTELDPEKKAVKRGVVRGLAIALRIVEDPYHRDDKAKLSKLERSFLDDTA